MNAINSFGAGPRRYRAAGISAAKAETLLTCPCCDTPNFSARGLSSHHCRAKPDRSRLNAAELELARQRAAKAA